MGISVIDFKFILEESQWNQFSMNYQNFVREFISKQNVYNERFTITNLSQIMQRRHNLLEFSLGELKVSMRPLKMTTFDELRKFIHNIE